MTTTKDERLAQAAINAILRGLTLQLKKMLQHSIDRYGPDLIVHARAGRGFRLRIDVMNADGSTYLGEPSPEQDVGEVRESLQLMKDDPEVACANCGVARKDHALSQDEGNRCDHFFLPGELM